MSVILPFFRFKMRIIIPVSIMVKIASALCVKHFTQSKASAQCFLMVAIIIVDIFFSFLFLLTIIASYQEMIA